MKKIILTTLLGVIFTQFLSAQSIFDKIINSEQVKDIVEDVASQHIDFSITGSWIYEGATLELGSDDKVANVGAVLAGSSIDNKLNEYLAKVGIKPGSMEFVFQEDLSFKVEISGRTVNGKYTYDTETKRLKLTFANLIPINSDVVVRVSDFSILFDADGLLNLIKAIAGKVDNSTISAINEMLKSYDHLKVGFKFETKNI